MNNTVPVDEISDSLAEAHVMRSQLKIDDKHRQPKLGSSCPQQI